MENSNGEMNADTYLKRRLKIEKASLVHNGKKMYFFDYFLCFEKINHFVEAFFSI
jgi:hypothetical protein